MLEHGKGKHPGAWAALGHRLSGLALVLFLPFHFLVLGLALENAAALDEFLKLAEMPLVKVAEWGLVMLLALHLGFGLRVLALEFLPWRDSRKGLIVLGSLGAVAAGAVFVVQVL
ncbi:hypothetical protein [Hwanghaeella sp.]|uniref:hypothetical protein n=1 Tax=Hwanghaeella sp. TaxID=2605943 RepID=UPI003CCBC3B3